MLLLRHILRDVLRSNNFIQLIKHAIIIHGFSTMYLADFSLLPPDADI
jgi:hypothetical protein